MTHLVIVESPAKAKTINKYLGKDYDVVASFGHVRDLPSKDGSVDPDQDFAMKWQLDSDSKKRMADIARRAKAADKLFLATDPDREGEAISWHVLDILNEKKALKDTDVKRVVFNEITKSAILKAMANPRDLDQELVDAYLARRALDYLVGFTLSPVLWRKLPGARSAGRVQSVALRIVCQRELEIENFVPQEYWSVEAELEAAGNMKLTARLAALDGKKLQKMSLSDKAQAEAAVEKIKRGPIVAKALERKPVKRHPSPPFTTSTLQQEAARKLGFSATHTMRVAQKLYEGKPMGGEVTGLITYMRTDGVSMAGEAIAGARQLIADRYGDDYLPEVPRAYKSKARNAQEAHEAVRPTDPRRTPADVQAFVDADELKLYELIWRRTIASQMESARLERTTITFENADASAELRTTGSIITFDGFMGVYLEGRDDEKEEEEKRLPNVAEGTQFDAKKIKPEQHFTEPPPRFSEASLVKKLEELGIGRPSTYASILSVLREREYVHLEKNRFIPDDKGRLVTAFLESFFERYVAYDFTADLEERLDHVSAGDLAWRTLLREFWSDFKPKTEEILGVRTTVVLDQLDEYLAPILFGTENTEEERKCPSCDTGKLHLKTSRWGAFVGCTNYPECNYTRPFGAKDAAAEAEAGPRVFGNDPETGLEVSLRTGRFGPYIQLGEGEDGEKPKRASIPKDMDAASMALEDALKLLSLPRTVGDHPETGKPITAAIGRYGPYVASGGVYASLKTTSDVFTVGINHAVSLIADKAAKRGGGAAALKELGEHPDGGPVQVMSGRYGPYVKYKRINATLPKGTEPESVTMEQALELIAAKAAKKPATKKKAPAKKPAAKKAPAKKTAAKKAPAKKPAAKKPAAKKSAS